jgi:hypothetical protein
MATNTGLLKVRPLLNGSTTADKNSWWWVYTHRTVVWLVIAIVVTSVVLGSAAGIISSAKGSHNAWVQWLGGLNLDYDFAWSELTAGEGSLFWIITVNGYGDYDAKNIAKFPLYPAVIRAIWEVTGRTISIPFLMFLIHTLMVWAGVAETYRFWEKYHKGYGLRAVLWLICSPLIVLHIWLFGFIEPGLIALLWLSLSLERDGKWAASSTALLILTMLQPSGIILACFIGVRRLWKWYQIEAPPTAILWAWLPAIVWLVWMIITSTWFDRFLAPYAFQADWGRSVFRWPWDRWARYINYALTEQFYWAHVITSVSLVWITIGYVWGSRLWFKLQAGKRQLLGGSWALPLFSFVIVVIPFCTAVYGANRYAATTLLGVWPLLFSHKIQSHPKFVRYERAIWLVFLAISLLVSFTIITDYGEEWGVAYWP